MAQSTVRSMTAFSREELGFQQAALIWEVRSVNHRYLDANVRLPETMRSLESPVRERLRKKLNRGKVDCTLQMNIASASDAVLELDKEKIQQYAQAVQQINAALESPAPINSLDLLFKPGVIIEADIDQDALIEAALKAFDEALDKHIQQRLREGEQLAEMIQVRLDKIKQHVTDLRPRIPEIIAAQKEKLLARVAECSAELDKDRLEQEVVLLAQKIDVDEELDRLDTHVQEVQRVLGDKGSIGRRLDFLMQELNREANTLSSKSITAETTLIAVDLKVLIEQMREQVQNIE